jgi:dUTP pyrophosphatase
VRYPTLKFQLLSDSAYEPKRGTKGSSGLDVFSPLDYDILPFGDVLVPLHIRFEIPFGWDLSVYNKSGVSTKSKLFKGAELVDSDYRGTIHIHLFNHSNKMVFIGRGDKIAQLVMRQVWMGELQKVNFISTETDRGDKGFGSTGEKA